LTDLAWLAWSSETRNKNTDKKFDPDWIATIENVEIGDVDGDNPLVTTQPIG